MAWMARAKMQSLKGPFSLSVEIFSSPFNFYSRIGPDSGTTSRIGIYSITPILIGQDWWSHTNLAAFWQSGFDDGSKSSYIQQSAATSDNPALSKAAHGKTECQLRPVLVCTDLQALVEVWLAGIRSDLSSTAHRSLLTACPAS